MQRNVLIVDDEPLQVMLLAKFIRDMDHNVIIMNKGQQVIDLFVHKKPVNGIRSNEIMVMLLDISMPDLDGLSVLRKIADVKGDLQVIVLTATNEMSSAITAVKLGACDYIIKGEKDIFARVVTSINGAIEKKNLKQQLSNLERKAGHQVSFSDIVGNNKELVTSINLSKKVVDSNILVLIEGESGTGKELLARAIHGTGSKSGKPFIVIDCKSLKQDNADVILFGCEISKKNGINKKSLGKFREAEGGTVFLNNVNMLDYETQTKILNLIQDGTIEPVGSSSTVKIGVRIISSSNQELESCVRHGRFREDLFYCLSAFSIVIPSLSKRGEDDIKMLAENFCHDFSVNENKKITTISNEALRILYKFDWEDNIRQLKSYIFRAVVLCEENILRPEHFPQIIHLNNLAQSKVSYGDARKKAGVIDLFHLDGVCKNFEEIEVEIFLKMLRAFDGNLSEASKKLKVGRSTIYRKLKLIP